jgi:hypothetical protein
VIVGYRKSSSIPIKLLSTTITTYHASVEPDLLLDMSGKEFGTITHGPTTHNNSPGIEHDERPMKRLRAKPDGAKECYEKVFKAAHTVQILERVSDRGAKHIDTAVEILTTAQSTRESRVYQTFLYDILID